MSGYVYDRKNTRPAAPAAGPATPAALSKSDVLRMSRAGAPQPMSPELREKFEPGFGADFSNIRISRGHIPEEMGVEAVAKGTDILIDSRAGMDVLGHELAHVVQQATGLVRGGYPLVHDAGLERQADIQGARAASGVSAFDGGMEGGTLSIAPMSSVSAPAQCKSKAEKAADKKRERISKMTPSVQTAMGQAVPSQQYDKNAMLGAMGEIVPAASQKIRDSGSATVGDRWNYFRGQGKSVQVPNGKGGTKNVIQDDERSHYFAQLRNVGRGHNAKFMSTLMDDPGAVMGTSHNSYKSIEAEAHPSQETIDNGRAPSREQQEKSTRELESYNSQAPEDMRMYLAQLEQNPEMLEALKLSQSSVYNPLADQGLTTGGKEETSHRALNDMLLRSLGPDSLSARNGEGVDPEAAKRAAIRVQAMMKLQTQSLSASLDPNAEMDDGTAAMRGVLQDFYMRNGMMDAPQQAQPQQPVVQPQPQPQPQPTRTISPQPGQQYVRPQDLPQSGPGWEHTGSKKVYKRMGLFNDPALDTPTEDLMPSLRPELSRPQPAAPAKKKKRFFGLF